MHRAPRLLIHCYKKARSAQKEAGMCSINGWVNLTDPHCIRMQEVREAGRRMRHRGPDGSGEYAADGVGFYHNRLAVMDPANGAQPMTRKYRGNSYTIVYNGEIYNTAELRQTLGAMGAVFETDCDTEAVLWAYILLGEDAPAHLNGIFAFAIHDSASGRVFLARDRMGVKPLFFATVGGSFYFASEPKALFAHKALRPEVSLQGLWRLVFLAPVTLPGESVFSQLRALPPAYLATVDARGVRTRAYWKLRASVCRDDAKTAAETVRELLRDTVHRQLQSDVPLAVLLSGGLDSSALTALAVRDAHMAERRLCTYSFEYDRNQAHFRASLFQPKSDDTFARSLARDLDTDHTILTATTKQVADRLFFATIARDLPGQADIDSSLLYYCQKIKNRHTVLFSGECSDEIFGGYPWFYRKEMLELPFLPWLHDPTERAGLFDPAILHPDEGLEDLREVCAVQKQGCPTIPDECEADRTARLATWLSMRLFMTNLLERKDRMSMFSAVEVRVPFADHRIAEYVFNLPWEIKHENGVEKALLRHAMQGLLPDYILSRKKNPYPKTHDPAYEARVYAMLCERLARKDGFLASVLDRKALQALMQGEDHTWFGQLMARAQLLAWLYQLDVFFGEGGAVLV